MGLLPGPAHRAKSSPIRERAPIRARTRRRLHQAVRLGRKPTPSIDDGSDARSPDAALERERRGVVRLVREHFVENLEGAVVPCAM